MGRMWPLDVVTEVPKLPPVSSAPFAGWVVVTFTEGRTMQEKESGEWKVVENLVDNREPESW